MNINVLGLTLSSAKNAEKVIDGNYKYIPYVSRDLVNKKIINNGEIHI